MPENDKDSRKKKAHGSNKRQRLKGVRAAVTPAEYSAIEERARQAGLSTGAYLRACALGDSGPRAKRAPPINRELLSEALASLNRVGNNINQIAKHLNNGNHPDRAAMATARGELMAILELILDAIGRAT